jgi:hypothetical protein
MSGPLVWLVCRDCSRKLGRGHLEGESTLEIKCKCGEVTSFQAQRRDSRLVPDGQGGYLTVQSQ